MLFKTLKVRKLGFLIIQKAMEVNINLEFDSLIEYFSIRSGNRYSVYRRIAAESTGGCQYTDAV